MIMSDVEMKVFIECVSLRSVRYFLLYLMRSFFVIFFLVLGMLKNLIFILFVS